MTKIICLEGIDGAGKTTQTKMLCEYLEGRGHKVGSLSFPVYDSFFGVEIGRRLADVKKEIGAIEPKSMALWYALDRWEAMATNRHLWHPPYDFLILNRFTLSTIVYQSLRANDTLLMPAWVAELEHEHLKIPMPDLYIVFDVSVAVSSSNVTKKGQRDYIEESHDIYERDKSLLERAREFYIQLSNESSNIELVNAFADGKLRPREDIFNDVKKLVKMVFCLNG
ncbi:dTMP kinase [Solidesulfovibrio carbinolicus]|uniref:Thymidylate kinase n=1 Tax=Solidesulfovibrio carbinolicus TaxID=296842 RepID=A0A4P6I406_9BACT|nr:hypothetical protein [Solidesulfovibrio carbinolicus]QAZ68669.1 hypothetical protein C3Y92_16095 [Solidesulfovibrio carbinolicus]